MGLKQLYRPGVKIIIHLKNDKVKTSDSDYSYLYWPYRYGQKPCDNRHTIVDLENFDIYKYQKYHPLIGDTKKDKRGRMYTYFFLNTGHEKIYHDDIQELVIIERFEEKDIDKVPIKTLEKDLGFRGYSELLFDRFEELKEERDRVKLAEELRIRSGMEY